MILQQTTDPNLKNYLTDVVSQLKGVHFWMIICINSFLLVSFSQCLVCVSEWLFECTVQKLVLVITSLETNDVLERWQFDIECDKSAKESRSVTDLAGFLLTCHLHPSQPFISFSF